MEKLEVKKFISRYKAGDSFQDMSVQFDRTVSCLRAIIRKKKLACRNHPITEEQKKIIDRLARKNMSDRDISSVLGPKGPSRGAVRLYRIEADLPDYEPNQAVRMFIRKQHRNGADIETIIQATIKKFSVERRFVRRTLDILNIKERQAAS